MSKHVPVLLKEVLELLQLKTGMNVIDCTLGDAGHAEKILEATAPYGKLLGIDADMEAVLRAKQFLYKNEDRVVFVRDNFVNLGSILEENNFGPANGILMDLGWSTPQFEDRGRGFSFLQPEEKLDMRFAGNEMKMSAADIVNELDFGRLVIIFKKYGEENLSKQIVKAIVDKRKEKRIETVGELVEIVLQVYRDKLKTEKEIPWIGGIHPATKVFQALRIAVNDELKVLEQTLPQAVEALAPGGRLAVISFHSGEDRIAKTYFKKQNGKILNIINKKPIVCSDEEGKENPRARSAKLRVIEKL
ncbi:MAG: 16S rRNA (cytosine(1402)-N(4))-methyltransferase RsmH [Candidatus Magasanikbacteria bacterium]|jgi:16S rRNA (cytosine1402-N4)-methyltransferase|nr:16S rRNA (cytosine(1402)-N(4))-methyltransferase RsmH [Candidatus Magasanikbacteria bacterium]MBT4314972.1 16S rRNA (cytosine(1402)-N(4))-methyltransferase RsmH [Candidatus Magasanikbacteria bacterium]MBT4546928.1 16S rRNA (cytosine(1402)-N(4))-methyltransferase RsmH [Candidatus Magasanikbacteria bacterium]MBT6819158.1 16S rRNA (cytosine(1402)-N(4))-methyltransferase RsmH [Candidatus Magasanikbacteria bacterium]